MIEVEKVEPNGLFTNYIYKAIPLAFDESMSYYETLCGLLNYMKNTIIPAVNNNADAVIEVQNLMTELQNYVDNYFDNEFPEMLDERLDELVENGTIASILENYANIERVFNTCEDMKEDTTLVAGQKIRTLGYYEINDSGSAEYIIKDEEPTSYYESIGTSLYAELVITNEMTPEQYGSYGDGEHDDTLAFTNAINNSNNLNLSKNYVITSQLTINKSICFKGVNSTITATLSGNDSVFKVLHSNVTFNNINVNLTYNGGGTTGEHGNIISIATYQMTTPLDIHDITIKNCNLVRTGTNSYNVGIFGDSHNITIENCYIYGECINLHWSGDFDRSLPDTSPCTVTYHPYDVYIINNTLEHDRGLFISSAYNVYAVNNIFVNNTVPLTLSIGDYGKTKATTLQKSHVMTGIHIENCSFNEYENQAVIFQGFGYREGDTVNQKNYIYTSQVNIENCSFGDSTLNPTTAMVGVTNFYGIKFNNCNFETTSRQNAIYCNPVFNLEVNNCNFNVAGHPISLYGGENITINSNDASVKNGYNFIRTAQYTFTFNSTTYKVKNLKILNNKATGSTILMSFNNAINTLIDNNVLLQCTNGVSLVSDNSYFTISNNTFDDLSETIQTLHINIVATVCKNLNVEKNNFRGGRGIRVLVGSTIVRVSNNSMLDNGFASGILCAIDSRTTKDVYLIGNNVGADTTLVYGNYYSKVDYVEI